MKVKILGSGTGLIAKDRRSASVLLTIDSQQLLFDCGWGSILNYYEGDLDPLSVDHIFITHPHTDHFGGLPLLFHSMTTPAKNAPNAFRTKPLNLHGYEGIQKDYETLLKVYWGRVERPFKINFYEYGQNTEEFDGFKITSALAMHGEGLFNAVSFRVDAQGQSLIYSGDTGMSEDIIKLSKDADLAVLEMGVSPENYREYGVNKGHLSPFELGIIASRANIKQVVIIHYHRNSTQEAILKDIRENYSGPVILAKDLQEIEF